MNPSRSSKRTARILQCRHVPRDRPNCRARSISLSRRCRSTALSRRPSWLSSIATNDALRDVDASSPLRSRHHLRHRTALARPPRLAASVLNDSTNNLRARRLASRACDVGRAMLRHALPRHTGRFVLSAVRCQLWAIRKIVWRSLGWGFVSPNSSNRKKTDEDFR